MINFNYEMLPNFGFIKAILSDEQINPIKDEINFIKKNFNNAIKYNKNLAGNIEKQYELKTSHLYVESLLLPLAQAYLNINNYKDYLVTKYSKYIDLKNETMYFKLIDIWVNFQSKHEFNPMHSHNGSLSFIIWIDIPFLMDEEFNQAHTKDVHHKMTGKFSFIYTDILGNIKSLNIDADKNYNNGVLLFPAELRHAVYPFFTSNKHRISVAGNFGIKTKENEST